MLGITIKKIISKAWAVITLLYNWPLPEKKPGLANSKRINKDKLVPTIPDQRPKIKYKVPMSLWLDLSSHIFQLNWYLEKKKLIAVYNKPNQNTLYIITPIK